MLKIGGKYKINKLRLESYSSIFGWDYDVLSSIDYVTITKINTEHVNSGITIRCYYIKEGYGYYPEDCLMTLRKEILERLLRC